MPAKRPGAPSPPSLLLILLLLAAVTLGVAATYLASPTDPFHATRPASQSQGPSVSVLSEVVFVIFFLALLFLAIYRLYSGGQRGQGRAVVTVLYVFLIAILFIVAAHYLATSSSPGALTNDTSGHPGTPPPPPVGGNNMSNETPGPLPIAPGIPGWVSYALLGAVALLLLLYLTPYVLARGKPEESAGSETARVALSLETALRALEPGAHADPRATVIALYARLLQELGPYLEHLDSATPREIERESVMRFGLSPDSARSLTRLFEEARYSSHPFTEAQVVQARGALETALADLKTGKRRP